jgi:hypothetical protein
MVGGSESIAAIITEFVQLAFATQSIYIGFPFNSGNIAVVLGGTAIGWSIVCQLHIEHIRQIIAPLCCTGYRSWIINTCEPATYIVIVIERLKVPGSILLDIFKSA